MFLDKSTGNSEYFTVMAVESVVSLDRPVLLIVELLVSEQFLPEVIPSSLLLSLITESFSQASSETSSMSKPNSSLKHSDSEADSSEDDSDSLSISSLLIVDSNRL